VVSPDVTVLVYAYREELPEHAPCRRWLEQVVRSDAAYGVSDLVLSGFIRVVTHPRIFDPPTPLDAAFEFAEVVRTRPNCIALHPGARHWGILERLCRETRAKGNLVADAYLAALAIESGCEWVTTDQDFSRFSGLRVSSPLD
jgi:toxin-antitoxin system PIN domain toxin